MDKALFSTRTTEDAAPACSLILSAMTFASTNPAFDTVECHAVGLNLLCGTALRHYKSELALQVTSTTVSTH